jgi:hypothetical protein
MRPNRLTRNILVRGTLTKVDIYPIKLHYAPPLALRRGLFKLIFSGMQLWPTLGEGWPFYSKPVSTVLVQFRRRLIHYLKSISCECRFGFGRNLESLFLKPAVVAGFALNIGPARVYLK